MFGKIKPASILSRVKAMVKKVPVVNVEIMIVEEDDSAMVSEAKSIVNFTVSAGLTLMVLIAVLNLIIVLYPLALAIAAIRIFERLGGMYSSWKNKRKEVVVVADEEIPATA